MVHVVPAQSLSDDVPTPITVDVICSRIELASMVCVLSSLLRLLVAIELTINPIIPSEPITRMAHAISISIIVMPACELLHFSGAMFFAISFPGINRSNQNHSRTIF